MLQDTLTHTNHDLSPIPKYDAVRRGQERRWQIGCARSSPSNNLKPTKSAISSGTKRSRLITDLAIRGETMFGNTIAASR